MRKNNINLIVYKAILIISSVTIIIIICSALLDTVYKPNYFIKTISPDRKWGLIVINKGAFLFGSHKLEIYYKKFIFYRKLFDYDLANDGKNLDEGNYSIRWDKNILYLTFKGEEQRDETFRIDIYNKAKYEKLK